MLRCIVCYIQFPSSSTCNMTSSPFSNSFNSHFFNFFAAFWYWIWYSSPLLISFSHPFRVLINHVLLTLLGCFNCYIQFLFLTCSIMTSSSFSNSFNSPFLFFYILFCWYMFCYFIVMLLFRYIFCYLLLITYIWYMFCYCIFIMEHLVYVLLLDSFGICFVISTPMTDLPILSPHAFSSSSCSLLTPFWPSSQSLSPVISLPSLPLFRFFLCSCSSFSSSLLLWFDY